MRLRSANVGNNNVWNVNSSGNANNNNPDSAYRPAPDWNVSWKHELRVTQQKNDIITRSLHPGESQTILFRCPDGDPAAAMTERRW